jgi:hypothetical protein
MANLFVAYGRANNANHANDDRLAKCESATSKVRRAKQPAVGSDKWHKVWKDNHKEGK